MLPDNLTAWTKKVLQQYNLKAGKRFGQHFLIDKKVLQAIIKTASLQPGERVLEVGGGLGVLTMALLDAGANVTCVEIDNRLAQGLSKMVSIGKLQVINNDILNIPDQELKDLLSLADNETFSIVSNLPYEISGIFLRKFLGSSLNIRQLVLLLQKEVAERLNALPGKMSLLSLLAQLTAQVEIIRPISPNSFYPPPQVNSMLVRITPKTKLQTSQELGSLPWPFLWRVARIGFSSKRKQLHNNLSSGFNLNTVQSQELLINLGLDSKVRAQELTATNWISLASSLISLVGSDV